MAIDCYFWKHPVYHATESTRYTKLSSSLAHWLSSFIVWWLTTTHLLQKPTALLQRIATPRHRCCGVLQRAAALLLAEQSICLPSRQSIRWMMTSDWTAYANDSHVLNPPTNPCSPHTHRLAQRVVAMPRCIYITLYRVVGTCLQVRGQVQEFLSKKPYFEEIFEKFQQKWGGGAVAPPCPPVSYTPE